MANPLPENGHRAARCTDFIVGLAGLTLADLHARYIAAGENMMEAETHALVVEYRQELALIRAVAFYRFPVEAPNLWSQT